MTILSRVVLAAVCCMSVAHSVRAQAGARTISRATLPSALRAELDKGQLKKVSATATDTVSSTATQVLIKPGEVLAAKTGTTPSFRGLERPRSATGTGRDSVRPITGTNPVPVRPESTTTTPSTDSVFALPFSYIGFDRAGGTPAYHPTFITRGGLRYSSARKRYEGSFAVGLELTETPGEERDLLRPVSINFGGEADSIFPNTVVFGRAGGPEITVSVFTATPRDSLRVLIIPKFDPTNPASLWLEVRPSLTIETPPRSMEGFGTESRNLRIGTRGVLRSDSINVSVSSDRGALGADELWVRRGGGSVRLRSAGGLGPTTISANAPGFEPAEATINFAFPYLFLGASLLGGVLGAAWAELRQRRRGTTATAARRIAGAVIGAILATAIYVGVGVNLVVLLVDAPLANEIAVFAFAALGGMFGLQAMARTAGKP